MKSVKPSATTDIHRAAVQRACAFIESSTKEPDLTSLAKAAGMSTAHFYRVFTSLTGITPKAYAAAIRAKRVRKNLKKNVSVTQAMYQAGYKSSGRFYENSTKMLGMTPKKFKKGGEGTVIRFAVGECSLGPILVAASEKGICDIAMDDDPDVLVRLLQDHFPGAQLIGADPVFEKLMATVIGFVERPAAKVSLPLDIQGTAFQQRVWQALRKIPLGKTATYADIAKAIGKPRAVRAVAQACGANHLAILIPCHRVVRTDGSLSGYRWGVERKRELLKREGRVF